MKIPLPFPNDPEAFSTWLEYQVNQKLEMLGIGIAWPPSL